jgi:hypothetical protein
MRKKCVLIWCAILVGLLFSCSELVLPKNVEVSGTLNVPLDVRVTNLNVLLNEALEKAFPADKEETKDLKIYEVDYKGQVIEAFFIYIPIETTEDLNPDHFLKIINTQINNNLSAEPRHVSQSVPPDAFLLPPGEKYPFPLSSANNITNISDIKIDEIARYVISIEFNECDNSFYSTDPSDSPDEGIGLDFYFEKLLPGIDMTLKCEQLSIEETKPLVKGHNIFGNDKPLTGEDKFALKDGDKAIELEFEILLKSNNNGVNTDILPINMSDITPEDPTIYEGDIIFFQNWKKATIDMHEAVKGEEGLTGRFPQNLEDGFDLSELGKYIEGFTFEGMVARIYVSGSRISGLDPGFELKARFNDKNGDPQRPTLYATESFEIDSIPLVLDDNYIINEYYSRKYLPGLDDDQPEFNVEPIALRDIFLAMPDSLFFDYQIKMDDVVDICPDNFIDDPNTIDSSKITPVVVIMLPIHLKASKDDSTISFPDLFGDMKDLFDRDKPETIFNSMDIKTLKMNVEFLIPFFYGGSLFLDGDLETAPLLFYPNGVKMGGKKITVDFDKTQRDIVEKQLIKPNMWFKFKNDEEVIVPKKLGVVSIGFEVGGKFNLGDILE